ncbi:MAG: class I SAM-dependent methyltransferase [Acidobacteriota bacterium]
MADDTIVFNNGAAYERYMGQWSQLAGDVFLDWLKPASQLQWLDIGCGNGAFTDLIVQRCAPASVQGVDPSEEQLAFARTRPVSGSARFIQGDAMALPLEDRSVDVAVMPLVIFFVPEPERGVAEMARVVRPGGIVAAYAWDMFGAGFPYDALQAEMRAMGMALPAPPSPAASRRDVMQDLWVGAGLQAVETREITVERTFENFDDYWATVQGGPSVAGRLAAMSATERAQLQATMRRRLPTDGQGRITYSARANAVKGVVPQS